MHACRREDINVECFFGDPEMPCVLASLYRLPSAGYNVTGCPGGVSGYIFSSLVNGQFREFEPPRELAGSANK